MHDMKLYRFDDVDGRLDLVPIAARRALDMAGLKLSLEAWRALPHAARAALTSLGQRAAVDTAVVAALLVDVAPEPMEPLQEPPADSAPSELVGALGIERPLPASLWATLAPLDRYALMKVSRRGPSERLAAAYREIVGQSAFSTHVGPEGGVRMVDVGEKAVTRRRAVAETFVAMSGVAMQALVRGEAPKGDVLGTARLAGIMGAKRTSELLPLCHPLSLSHCAVDLDVEADAGRVRVVASVETTDRTGVEMEALTAASVAALTLYDMLKAIDRGMQIGPTRLTEKSGGRSGDYRR